MRSKLPPSISIISCSYNYSNKYFIRHLAAIKNQNYPKNKIEHIIMDGGSSDDTAKLAMSYGAKVFVQPGLRDFAQIRMSQAISKAKNDLILILEPDNILLGKNWLKDIVQPFIDNEDIFCSYSMYNGYTKDLSLLTKYCALFGIPDPTLYYLKKSEKLPIYKNKYDLGEIISDNTKYTIVKFNKTNLPTLGDNGHVFRSKMLKKVNTDHINFAHTDAVMQLLLDGHNTVAVVKNKIIHITESNILKLARQRVRIKSSSSNNKRIKRKYLVFDPSSSSDRFNLIIYIIISFTLVIAIAESIRGYIYKREIAWFLHPIMCILMIMAYTYSSIKGKLNLSSLGN